jgi:hypothetical protein
MHRFLSYLALLIITLSSQTAFAHIGYTNRDLGTYTVVGTLVTGSNNSGSLVSSGSSATFTITNQNTGEAGWANGTDARFGDSHVLRAYRFTLVTPAIVTIEIVGLDYTSGISFSALEHPAFSLFQGLAHLAPAAADHDSSAISQAWLTSLVGAGNHEGAFNALGSWKIGSDDGITFADLTSFLHVGHAADGTAANYGSASGINGDGVADGLVTATFSLGAGDYSLLVGGGNFAGVSSSSYGYEVALTVVPEPSVAGLIGLAGAAGWITLRRRMVKRPSPADKS